VAIEGTQYLSYPEAVYIHLVVMRFFGEERYGVFDRALVESALARPRQAAAYEGADLIRQAATLIAREFLKRNGMTFTAPTAELVDLVFAIEADRSGVDEIETWLRQRASARV
jgi:prophage maintenance system killer protein